MFATAEPTELETNEVVESYKSCQTVLMQDGIFDPESIAAVGLNLIIWAYSSMLATRGVEAERLFRAEVAHQVKYAPMFSITDEWNDLQNL